jgi:hypothetical protein
MVNLGLRFKDEFIGLYNPGPGISFYVVWLRFPAIEYPFLYLTLC